MKCIKIPLAAEMEGKGIDKESNAEQLETYNRTHIKRKTKVNVCNGRANWNACDYIDFGKQEYGRFGCECWKQDNSHKCCRCIELKTVIKQIN